MKREELQRILGEEASSETIDAILNAAGADIESAKRQSSGKINSLQEQIEALTEQNKVLSEKQNANLTDAEKFEKELKEAAERELAAKTRLATLAAEKEFASAGITEKEYKGFIPALSALDEETATATAKSIAEMVKTRTEAAIADTKKTVMGNMGGIEGGEENEIPTKEQFDKLTYSEQMKVLEKAPELLKQFGQKKE